MCIEHRPKPRGASSRFHFSTATRGCPCQSASTLCTCAKTLLTRNWKFPAQFGSTSDGNSDVLNRHLMERGSAILRSETRDVVRIFCRGRNKTGIRRGGRRIFPGVRGRLQGLPRIGGRGDGGRHEKTQLVRRQPAEFVRRVVSDFNAGSLDAATAARISGRELRPALSAPERFHEAARRLRPLSTRATAFSLNSRS